MPGLGSRNEHRVSERGWLNVTLINGTDKVLEPLKQGQQDGLRFRVHRNDTLYLGINRLYGLHFPSVYQVPLMVLILHWWLLQNGSVCNCADSHAHSNESYLAKYRILFLSSSFERRVLMSIRCQIPGIPPYYRTMLIIQSQHR